MSGCFAAPQQHWVGPLLRYHLAAMGNHQVVFVERYYRGGVRNGEFMQDVYQLEQLHAKGKHFGVIHTGKEFLHLGKAGHEQRVGAL